MIQLRTLAIAGAVTFVACIVVGSIGLKTMARWLSPEPVTRPRPIVFDNGSVRALPASAPLPPTKAHAAQSPPGRLRKCLKPGGEVVYSNLDCPPGAKEAPIRTDGVSVVSSGLPPSVVPSQAPDAAVTGKRPLGPGETLQQRATAQAIDRATGGSGR